MTEQARTPRRIGVASDHGGHALKEHLAGRLRAAGYEVKNFGDSQPVPEDDYPDFVVPLARAVAAGKVDRGVAMCGSERFRRRLDKVAALENPEPGS